MWREVGGGFRMGNTCTPVVDSCCTAMSIPYREENMGYGVSDLDYRPDSAT